MGICASRYAEYDRPTRARFGAVLGDWRGQRGPARPCRGRRGNRPAPSGESLLSPKHGPPTRLVEPCRRACAATGKLRGRVVVDVAALPAVYRARLTTRHGRPPVGRVAAGVGTGPRTSTAPHRVRKRAGVLGQHDAVARALDAGRMRVRPRRTNSVSHRVGYPHATAPILPVCMAGCRRISSRDPLATGTATGGVPRQRGEPCLVPGPQPNSRIWPLGHGRTRGQPASSRDVFHVGVRPFTRAGRRLPARRTRSAPVLTPRGASAARLSSPVHLSARTRHRPMLGACWEQPFCRCRAIRIVATYSFARGYPHERTRHRRDSGLVAAALFLEFQ